MRYGMCTDIATATRDRVEYELLKRIKEAGFDFVEFPLMMIETLSDDDFEVLLAELKRLGLACDCSCNFFPGRIKVTGPSVNKAEIDAYLDKAMGRAQRMGVKKIVFGSNNSRNIPDGWGLERGYDQMCEVIEELIIPYCRKYGIMIVMEPIRKQSGNILLTVKDGEYFVNRINKPEIRLLADLMHMQYNEENPEDLRDVRPMLHHVHICEMDRMLPEDGFSEFLQKALKILKELGYDETISFESKGGTGPDSLKNALTQLKRQFCS
ncbi:MAG TPA: sugar phosphate isomerase/epimerase family protein [Sphaerochaeta sp.]|nr:sugar phosphate isomerase/epimerase family protein [Sphaerochaeta sp.]HPK63545.1 sugar phosphate isomerase/epimerase family protein [Sphaerochaeta sp.]